MLKLKIKYHLAFDVKGGPDEEIIEFKTKEELENILSYFPTLVLKEDIVFKKFPEGNIAIGKILQDK